jgi:hypothetical protein
MLKIYRTFFSVSFVWCLVLGNTFADETRTFSLDLTSEDAELHIDNLVPGVKNSFCLLLRNRTGSDLSFEAIRPSCGCMIVAPVQKQFRNEESLSIPVSLLVDSSNTKFGRVLTIIDSSQNEWNIQLSCSSLIPIEIENKIFELENTSESRQFSVPLFPKQQYLDLVGDLASAKCEVLGTAVEYASIKRIDDRCFIDFRATAGINGLRGTFSENVRITGERYACDMKLAFSCLNTYRVTPKTVSKIRLREDLQKVVVAGGSDSTKIKIVGRQKNGEVVPIEVEAVGKPGRLQIFRMRLGSSDLDYLSIVEVFCLENENEIKICELKVVD